MDRITFARRKRIPGINIVPLVDVLTVLLFFFLVTMQVKTQSILNITVPEIKTAGKNALTEEIVIAIDTEGSLFLNNQPVEKDVFDAAIKLAGEMTPEIPILLVADENVPLRFVTQVMDTCRSNRLNKIRIQAR